MPELRSKAEEERRRCIEVRIRKATVLAEEARRDRDEAVSGKDQGVVEHRRSCCVAVVVRRRIDDHLRYRRVGGDGGGGVSGRREDPLAFVGMEEVSSRG